MLLGNITYGKNDPQLINYIGLGEQEISDRKPQCWAPLRTVALGTDVSLEGALEAMEAMSVELF